MRRCCSFGPSGLSLGAVAAAGLRAAALYALAVSFSLRTRGVYFIMVTLAFAQMAYYAVHDTPLGGGTDGIYRASRRNWRPGPRAGRR